MNPRHDAWGFPGCPAFVPWFMQQSIPGLPSDGLTPEKAMRTPKDCGDVCLRVYGAPHTLSISSQLTPRSLRATEQHRAM